MLSRTRLALSFLFTVHVSLFTAGLDAAWACPMCAPTTPDLVERYGSSFFLLLLAPAAIAIVVGARIRRSLRSHREP